MILGGGADAIDAAGIDGLGVRLLLLLLVVCCLVVVVVVAALLLLLALGIVAAIDAAITCGHVEGLIMASSSSASIDAVGSAICVVGYVTVTIVVVVVAVVTIVVAVVVVAIEQLGFLVR